jgi:hypothetical protein
MQWTVGNGVGAPANSGFGDVAAILYQGFCIILHVAAALPSNCPQTYFGLKAVDGSSLW